MENNTNIFLREISLISKFCMQFLFELIACYLPEYRIHVIIETFHHERKLKFFIALAFQVVENKVFHKSARNLCSCSRGAIIKSVLLLFDKLIVKCMPEFMR